MKPFLSKFTIDYPIAKMSPSERKKIEDSYVAAETAKIEEANKGKKPKKGEAEPPPPVITLPSVVNVSMFESATVQRINLVCAQLLIEIASLDCKLSNPSYVYFNELADGIDKLVTGTADQLINDSGSSLSGLN